MSGLELLSNPVVQIVLAAAVAGIIALALYSLANSQGKVEPVKTVRSTKSFAAVPKSEKKKPAAAAKAAVKPKTSTSKFVDSGDTRDQWASTHQGLPELSFGAPVQRKTHHQQQAAVESKPRRGAPAASPLSPDVKPAQSAKTEEKPTASPKAPAKKSKDGFEVVGGKKDAAAKKAAAVASAAVAEESKATAGEPSVLDLIFASSTAGRGSGRNYRAPRPIVTTPVAVAKEAPVSSKTTVGVSSSTRGWAKIDADSGAAE